MNSLWLSLLKNKKDLVTIISMSWQLATPDEGHRFEQHHPFYRYIPSQTEDKEHHSLRRYSAFVRQ